MSIIITGASRGIGRACAEALAMAGAPLVINYLNNRQAAAEVVAGVEAMGGQAIAVQGDMGQEADVIRLFDAAPAPITGVIINAGIVGPKAVLADMSVERLQGMLTTNTLSALLTAREAARRMGTDRGGQGGSIVVMSSAAARIGSPNEYVDYAASKGALDTMTLGLAKELGPVGIRVNAIRPGVTLTDIHASGGQPDRAERIGALVPLGRAGDAAEVAAAAAWLLSDAASYTTGALLDVAGGR
ncbi:NAD(P)-dependent dehydrogenase (short-subunit alcohol dehydrogenase family) [Rubricella aquisinus]|uniref:NAD(P)-dependent dehydrogenase (Short-subunit alcohol dehydrogenase family) n=1 Tax=Rubricella aquisinus TaxID=2028108 RepID=A0A840WUS3_9RHOB|nr:SDR family oxidoreductase [Rubricella aquisinus]MBB5514960.1 NAD(P)-dependent dehydrogenase (short-subunit alcohol dehydrogenase family) [Rubricella aquisinus]